MSQTVLQTPEDAEEEFYNAFESCDLQRMMNVWLNSEESTCIHPGIPRLDGYEMVREGWRLVLENQMYSRIKTTDVRKVRNAHLSVHLVREEIKMGEKLIGVMLVTNIYRKVKGSWKIVSHHASPEPEVEYEEADSLGPDIRLH